MSSFLGPLRIEKIAERRWMLTDDLAFDSTWPKCPGVFIAPRGFQTDLASIPQVLWSVLPHIGNWDRAATIHDAAYGNVLTNVNGDRMFVVKKLSDGLFYEGMRADGVGWWTARRMWRAVSAFGDPKGHPLAAHRHAQMALADAGYVPGVLTAP
jgi:hypothetical protein